MNGCFHTYVGANKCLFEVVEHAAVLDLVLATEVGGDRHRVLAVDRDAEALRELDGVPGVETRVLDLEAGAWPLAGERFGAIVGYAYGRLEGADWNLLLAEHGALHDVWVEPEARRAGVARRLVTDTCARLTRLGAPRVLLHSAWQNIEAHALFERLGFRRTMVEMTREADGTP